MLVKPEGVTTMKVLPLPVRTLLYQCPKWIPNLIPLDKIQDVADAFERLPRLKAWGENYRWDKFLVKRNQVLFWTSFYLALRPNEAVSLKFADVFKDDEGDYQIKIRGANNKRRKDRMLSIPKQLQVILHELLSNFEYKKFWGNSEYLFPSYMNRSKNVSRYQWNDLLQCAYREAGLWRKHPTKNRGLYTAYSLRHSRAVDLLQKSNFDLWAVANVLGHGRIDVVTAYLPMCPIIQRHMKQMMNN